MTVPPASRVATFPFSAVKAGHGKSAGSLPSRARSNCAANAGFAVFQLAYRWSHSDSRPAPFAPVARKNAAGSSGTVNGG